MKGYQPNREFTDRVMEQVQSIHQRREQRMKMVEGLLDSLPVRLGLSTLAAICGIWNLARIGLVIFSPLICK